MTCIDVYYSVACCVCWLDSKHICGLRIETTTFINIMHAGSKYL